MKKLTKEQLYGFGSSLILCLLILLILSFVFLRTEVMAEMEGIPVDFGVVAWSSGANEPAPSVNSVKIPDKEPEPAVISKPDVSVPKPQPPTPEAPVITQTAEQTAAIEAEKQRKEQERQAEKERREVERKRLEEEQRERREAERKRLEEEQRRRDDINRQMAEAFGKGNTDSGSQGTTISGPGNQGSPQGNTANGAQTGGGIGSFDLKGRSLRGGELPRPAYDVQEEGTIVVEITVNPQGDVIQATVRLRGTNIENPNMRRSAVAAAQKAKFNSINDMQNQIGTITYKYTLK